MKKFFAVWATIVFSMVAFCSFGGITASAEENLLDGVPLDPAEREKKVVYISTLGELLSYTYDFYNSYGVDYVQNKLYNEYTLVLTQDMDLETDTSWHAYAPEWESKGWPARNTHANIEGAGHTISNMWATYGGLFNYLSDNFVRNLNIEYNNDKMAKAPDRTKLSSTEFSSEYGGLAFEADNSIISNVHVEGNFHMANRAVGIIAWPRECTIENCSFEGDLSGVQVGGIAAIGSASLHNCFFKGSIMAYEGGGGMAFYLVSSNDPTDKYYNKEYYYTNNIAIVTEIVKLKNYEDDYQPLSSFIGKMTEENISRLHMNNNYILNVPGYPQATKTPGSGWSTRETYPVTFTESEVKGFDEKTMFADEANMPGLDFEKYWYMDETLGEPRLKKNRISIIDMTEEEWQDDFTVSTEDRYYGEDDGAALVKGTIKDKTQCQLIYLTLDGVDVLGKIALESLPLFTDQSHVIVVKAGGLGEASIPEENITAMKVNGEEIMPAGGKYSFPYKKGETVRLEIEPADGYEIKALEAGEGYEIKETESGYEVTFLSESALKQSKAELNIALEKKQGGGENPDTTTWSAVVMTVGVVVLMVLGVIIYERKKV